MREIAAQAGYSPGLAYRYFAGKEELMLLLYEQLALGLASYGLHLALVLFWLLDQSAQGHRTRALLGLCCGAMGVGLRFIRLAPVAGFLSRLAAILGPLLGAEDRAEPADS